MSLTDRELRIAIVEDHPVVVEGLRKILMSELRVKDVLEFHAGNDFIKHLKSQNPFIDIVLLDITLPDANGVELCRDIKGLSTETCILGFSNHNNRTLVMQMLANGASGYLLKNVSSKELVHCISEALSGRITFSEEISQIISKPSPAQLKPIPPLTKREKEILKMLVDGKTSIEISQELCVSPLTIETHRRNMMHKFEVNNVTSLIKTASLLKLI